MGQHISLRVLLMGAFLTLALPTAWSQPYFNVDGGVAIAEKVKLNQFENPTPGLKIDFDPGFRIGVAGGYNFTPFLGAEIESGFIYNRVKTVIGAPSGANFGDSSLSHVPLLANVVLRYDQPNVPWIPYAGAGAGGDVSIITLDNVSSPSGSGTVDGSDATIRFAWQAFGGIRFKINEQMSIGAGYKYYAVNNASWDLQTPSGKQTDAIQIGHARVHSFLVEFNIKF